MRREEGEKEKTGREKRSGEVKRGRTRRKRGLEEVMVDRKYGV